MPRRHQLERTLTRLGALLVAAVVHAACTAAPPRADSTAAAPTDSVAPGASAATSAAAPVDTSRTPPPPTRSPRRDTGAADTTPTRPRLVPRPPRPVPMPMPPRDTLAAGDEDADRRAIDQLRREARALAHTDGCATASQCAVLPLGERACGGPEEYLVYCPRSTDVAALTRKADALAAAQRAFNTKYGVASTCDMRLAPTATLAGGRCAPAPTPPADVGHAPARSSHPPLDR